MNIREYILPTSLSGGPSKWKSGNGNTFIGFTSYKYCILHFPELCTSATSFIATNQLSFPNLSWDFPPLANRHTYTNVDVNTAHHHHHTLPSIGYCIILGYIKER